MTARNGGVVRDQCVKNDRGDLATSDPEKHLALNEVKKGKVSGNSGVVLEILLASEDLGTEHMKNLFKQIIAESKVREDWNPSVIVKVFKNKSEANEQVNYRGLKLREQMMKVFERVMEQKIREMVDKDAMHFGFLPGKSTMDAIFKSCQLKKLYLAFVDLQNAFDGVPREVVK